MPRYVCECGHFLIRESAPQDERRLPGIRRGWNTCVALGIERVVNHTKDVTGTKARLGEVCPQQRLFPLEDLAHFPQVGGMTVTAARIGIVDVAVLNAEQFDEVVLLHAFLNNLCQIQVPCLGEQQLKLAGCIIVTCCVAICHCFCLGGDEFFFLLSSCLISSCFCFLDVYIYLLPILNVFEMKFS